MYVDPSGHMTECQKEVYNRTLNENLDKGMSKRSSKKLAREATKRFNYTETGSTTKRYNKIEVRGVLII